MAGQAEVRAKRKVILDTDPGLDDLQAILMLLADPNVEILAFTTVAGNACYKQVVVNTHKILQFTGRTGIPVYQGSNSSLYGNCPKSDNFFGEDACANCPHPVDMNFKKEELSSAEALLHYTRKFPGEIDLIAVGPMTNLAAAYLVDNDFPNRLKSLTLLVGDDTEKTVFNVSPYAEFNCWCDPVSLKIVCNHFFVNDSNKKIKLLDFNLCQRNLLSFERFDKFYGRSGEPVELNILGKSLSYAYDYIKTKNYQDGAVTCDPFAVFLALYPESKHECKLVKLTDVCLAGEKFGHTVFTPDSAGNVQLVKSLDLDHFWEVFYATVTKPL